MRDCVVGSPSRANLSGRAIRAVPCGQLELRDFGLPLDLVSQHHNSPGPLCALPVTVLVTTYYSILIPSELALPWIVINFDIAFVNSATLGLCIFHPLL